MTNIRALKIVREQRRLNISDVASYADISESRLKTFEDGNKQPSRKQLERLARLYGVPLYAFYSDVIPNLSDTPRDYRKHTPSPASLSARGMKSVLNCEKISHFSYQLFRELNLTTPSWPNQPQVSQSIAQKAESLRKEFDVWVQPRLDKFGFIGTTEQKILGALRLFFEMHGNIASVNDAPVDDYMGFYLKPDSGLPIIFVNRVVSSKKAQLFTFAHEFAHAILKEEGISNPFVVQNAIERSCNIFAAEFLAPISTFKKLAESQSRSTRDDIFKFIALVSSRSLLSQHATAIRLVESGYLSQNQLRTWEDFWKKNPRAEKQQESEEAGPTKGGHAHAKRVSEIGSFPVYLAATAVQKKLIDSLDVQAGIGLTESLQDQAFSLVLRRFEIAKS
jgi:Zn-dependent peptidase ImmA (M78 family)